MTKRTELSATMAVALAAAVEHGGKLVRHAGGFRPSFDRGRLFYSEWKSGRGFRFPIEAELTEDFRRELAQANGELRRDTKA